jgi:hypothetical protein
MRKTTLALCGILLAATALLITTPAPAMSRPAVASNWLYLTVAKGDTRTREIHGRLLMCDPPRGHARAAKACAELAAAHGDVDRIPPERVYCPMIYAPVTVSARGQWAGRRIDYGHTFANACDMAARTGAVFALSDQDEGRRVRGLPH